MNKKQLIVSLSLVATVLLSVLLQSVHTYEHFVKLYSQTECHHKYNNGNTEITHQHHNIEDCKVCQFAFGSYTSPSEVVYRQQTDFKTFHYFLENVEQIIAYSGSLYSHRGPPVNC